MKQLQGDPHSPVFQWDHRQYVQESSARSLDKQADPAQLEDLRLDHLLLLLVLLNGQLDPEKRFLMMSYLTKLICIDKASFLENKLYFSSLILVFHQRSSLLSGIWLTFADWISWTEMNSPWPCIWSGIREASRSQICHLSCLQTWFLQVFAQWCNHKLLACRLVKLLRQLPHQLRKSPTQRISLVWTHWHRHHPLR